MKKVLCMALSLMLCLSCLPAAWAESAEEKVHLTIAVKEDMLVEDWKTNEMTKYLEEAGGFDLEFMVLPSKEYIEKLNMMVVDGGKDLPDIIMGTPSDAMLYSWAQAGAIVPLTKYYEDESLTPNIREAWARTGVDYRSQITQPDGEIYAIPSLNQSYGNEHPVKLFIYKPYLDALGMEVPTTTDELYEVLKAVVSTDLNGNGKQDEIGLIGTSLDGSTATDPSGWFQAIMNSFVYAGDSNYFTVEDGKVGVAYNQEGWKKGLSYLAKLYREGLIAPESLTQDLTSFKATFNAEEAASFMLCYYTATGMLDGASPRKDEYVGIDPLAGPDGVSYITYRPSVASTRMIITANCKDPEAAFRLGDLMSSEFIGITQRWGQEGVDWDYIKDAANPDDYEGMYEVAGFDKYIVCYDDATFWASGTPQNRSWRQQGPYVRQYAIANGQAMVRGTVKLQESMLAAYQYQLHNGTHNPAEVIPKLIYTSEESKIASEKLNDLKTYVHETAANVIAGNIDIDEYWDAYLAELEMIGVNELVEVVQGVYDRMYK